MREDFLLLNPGPVPVTREVREAMGERMVSHRSAEFEAVYERAQDQLDYVFTRSTLDESSTATGGTSLILNGTASMGMEAAVANTVDADGEVVAVVNGKFGRRFKRIAERYASVTPVEFDWGDPVDVDAVEAAVTDDTDVVTIVHNETSTGLLNPVPEVGEIADAHDATYVVDGVTSIGGDVFKVDDWNVDIAVTDSQKALAAPPGVSALFVTGDAEAAIDGDRAPFYEDLDWHLRKAESHQTPFTSAVPLFRGLAVAVEDIREEGMAARIERHREQATAFREAFHAMGLDSFPDRNEESEYSNTVTAIALPESIRGDDSTAFFDAVEDRGVSISGGQAHLGGEIFRVSNMGHLSSEQVIRGIRTVGEAFEEVGVDADTEAALETARDVLR
ncbi:pyridoxal-phosphate-dependent aminotransferase family protein [Halanaeroarchaeum sulfurireducens]|uniref:Alanine-glyoxylate transaminase n=1 Tax=Halanaeroarchaeum sulfurireducens TaxID=1604004 RepID=A0A0F7PG84_9EURY|nr:alanine--glyoxylate aminotransferase family protein [Halanaeroarchaeum sulfurireducens]AKH98614.1 alanine-glyoxylate transaminase [Halanaeroarchaeum sulfurireducens]ALG83056.1 alanine-glyoxylate transaminase [Halanaeroarchaeum sulfurireducens]